MSYEAAREKLRTAELELVLQRERVAELRRELPVGPAIENYEFGSASGPVRLSELFADPSKPLVLYHFMFGRNYDRPCPMCSMWADGWQGVADHLAQNLTFVVVSSAPIEDTLALAAERGWQSLRWVSAADNTFKADIGGEHDGDLSPFISVYELIDGEPHLAYSGGAHIVDDHWRGVDLLSPVWHFLDLTRNGRHDWMPSLDY